MLQFSVLSVAKIGCWWLFSKGNPLMVEAEIPKHGRSFGFRTIYNMVPIIRARMSGLMPIHYALKRKNDTLGFPNHHAETLSIDDSECRKVVVKNKKLPIIDK